MLDGSLHLARAVIAQALSDVRLSKTRGINRDWTPAAQAEAINFLTAGGEWRRARVFWSSLAEIDPDALRARVLAALPSQLKEQPVNAAPTSRRPRAGTKFAALFDQLHSPEGVSVDEAAAQFSWDRNTVFSYMMSDMPTKLGVKPLRCADGRYRLVQDAPRAA